MASYDRYQRQTSLRELGLKGQQQLANARVVIVGCGGLGSVAAPYLAGAGVGSLTLIDGDTPDVTNLHRQVFYHTDATDRTKAEVLADHIRLLNPEVAVTVHGHMLSKTNIDQLLSTADLVLECTDHIWTKYLVNDYCHLQGVPMIYAALYKYDGYVSVFENSSPQSIHLRDIYPEVNADIPTCSEVGVLGTVAGLMGILQANEAIKFITGIGTTLEGHYLTYNGLTNEQLRLQLAKTYVEDMQAVYDQTSYQDDKVCSDLELTYAEVMTRRDAYSLISVLPAEEHRAIDDKVFHQPMTGMDYRTWSPPDDKPVVLYCMSGKRSLTVVKELIAHDGTRQVYSLRGGLSAAK